MQQSILKRVHDSEMHRSGSTKRCIDGDILDEPITDAPSRYDLTTSHFFFSYLRTFVERISTTAVCGCDRHVRFDLSPKLMRMGPSMVLISRKC
jgi:hypothetical protein